jgi:DNA-binding SARP family transcriptional activator
MVSAALATPTEPTAPLLRLLGTPGLSDPFAAAHAHRYRKGQALLYYLAIMGGSHARGDLAHILWPELNRSDGQRNLRVILHALRQALGDNLITSKHAVALSAAMIERTDLHAFRRWSQREADLGIESPVAEASHRLLDRFSLAGTPTFEGWLASERAAFSEEAARAWARAAEAASASGRTATALAWLQRATDATPCDETRQRTLIALLRRFEGLAAAQAQVQRLREALHQLGREPDHHTRQLLTPASATPDATRVPLIGHDYEVDCGITALLQPNVRWLTVVGPPGSGTSTVAMAIAERAQGQFGAGTLRIPLHRVHHLHKLRERVLNALATPRMQSSSAPALADSLPHTPLLLILDDVDPSLDLREELLDLEAANASVKAIIATRQRLELPCERTLRLGPLNTNTRGSATTAATQLLLTTAQLHDIGLQVSDSDLPRLEHLSQRLAGHPLALVLAGAKFASLGVAGLEVEEDALITLLASSDSDSERRIRHRSLPGSLRPVVQGLSAPARALAWALLGYASAVPPEAVARVGGWSATATHRGLAELVSAGAAYRYVQAGGSDRFQALPGLRAAMSESEPAELRKRHALIVFDEVAHDARESVGLGAAHALARYRDHRSDVERALAYFEARDPLRAITMAAGAWRLEVGVGRALQAARRLNRLLDHHAAALHAPERSDALHALAAFYAAAEHNHDARRCYQQALALRRDLGDIARIAQSLIGLAHLDSLRGNYQTAHARLREGLDLARQVGDDRLAAIAHAHLGTALMYTGEAALAVVQLGRAWRLFREVADFTAAAGTLMALTGATASANDQPTLTEALHELSHMLHDHPPGPERRLRAACELARERMQRAGFSAEADRLEALSQRYLRAAEVAGQPGVER